VVTTARRGGRRRRRRAAGRAPPGGGRVEPWCPAGGAARAGAPRRTSPPRPPW